MAESFARIFFRNCVATGELYPVESPARIVDGFKTGDEGIEYIINQMIEFLLISRNVEEVFAADNTLRQKIFAVMKKHLDVDDEIDREARARLKHLPEGTTAFDIEYNKIVEQIRRARGLI